MSNTTVHRRFCENDGWELWKDKADHWYYRKLKEDGTFKYTKISRGRKDYGKKMWNTILKKQLEVDQEYFNNME
ncbi:type II toxin-antitoxin system HicA family toxin [Psychrobacillus sp. L4]|uniref:type II toxin-antitoxin system HicA family toxin n=1 Tax=Psychrobacillus sp. L4 TaxID=3236892 RepID=UPI0036F3EE20